MSEQWAVVSSPPYAGSRPEASGPGVNLEKQYVTYRASGGGMGFESFCDQQRRHAEGYGESEGQLGMMREGADAGAAVGASTGACPYSGDWHGLYGEGWGKEIVRDAYAHPAKFARGLIRRIYDHLIEEGYLEPGMRVLDPFGGVALGALDCMRVGCDWLGVELEEKFVRLGRSNLERWERRYRGAWDWWGRAELVQGDSRYLLAVADGQDAVVSSPPWVQALATDEEKRGGVFNDPEWLKGTTRARAYGESEGQLGIEGGETFWEAARMVVDGCAGLLDAGGVAVWVVKRFVRDKEIVEFPDQWRRMCEAAGFRTVEWIRVWVVERNGVQVDLWGNGHEQRKERKSFFRRLYEKKYPENAIDWEDVLIMRRL